MSLRGQLWLIFCLRRDHVSQFGVQLLSCVLELLTALVYFGCVVRVRVVHQLVNKVVVLQTIVFGRRSFNTLLLVGTAVSLVLDPFFDHCDVNGSLGLRRDILRRLLV